MMPIGAGIGPGVNKARDQAEAEVQLYREKSERAEDWLRKIFTEIEDRLINQPQE